MAWTFKATMTASNSGSAKTNYQHKIELSPASTTVTGTEAIGQTVITLGDTTGMTAGDWLIFDTGGGAEEWKQIDTVDTGTQVTLLVGLENEQASTNCDNADQHIVDNTQSAGEDIRVTPVGSTASLLDHWIEVWDGTTHIIWVEIPSIGGSGSTDVDVHYGGGAVSTTSSISNTFIFGEDFSSPLVGTSNEQLGKARLIPGNDTLYSPIISVAAGSWREKDVREHGKVVNDTSDTTWPYKFYYTGRDNSNVNAFGLAVSTDGTTWQPYYKAETTLDATEAVGQSVISVTSTSGIEAGDWVVFDVGGADEEWHEVLSVVLDDTITLDGTTLANEQSSGTTLKVDTPVINVDSQDPWVFVDDDGSYHLYCEDLPTASDIDHYTSSDKGYTWTADGANPVLSKGAASSWEEVKIGSPMVIKSGSTYYMVYDGVNSGSVNQQIGYATNSSPSGAWTKYGSNPMIAENSPSWPGASQVPSDLINVGSTWYLIVHDGDESGVWSTTDAPADWDTLSFSIITDQDPYSQPNEQTTFLSNSRVTAIDAENNDDNIIMYDLLGDDEWTFARHDINSPIPWLDGINAHSGLLTFETDPASSNETQAAYTSSLSLTINFRVLTQARYRTAVNANHTRLTIGTGGVTGAVLTEIDGVSNWGTFSDGYSIFFRPAQEPDEIRVQEINSGVSTTKDNAVTDTNLDAYTRLEIRYHTTDTGTFSLHQNGSQIGTPFNDTTFQATAKNLMLSQGAGAASDWKYIAVANFDGTDTTNAIGQPASENEASLPAAAAGGNVLRLNALPGNFGTNMTTR